MVKTTAFKKKIIQDQKLPFKKKIKKADMFYQNSSVYTAV